MKATEIVKILKAHVVLDTENLDDLDIKGAFSADLMSDVLYYDAHDYLLITGLIKPQVVRTAFIAGIRIIVFTQNKKPDKDTLELAQQKKIPLLVTPLSTYATSGKLYQAGLQGIQF